MLKISGDGSRTSLEVEADIWLWAEAFSTSACEGPNSENLPDRILSHSNARCSKGSRAGKFLHPSLAILLFSKTTWNSFPFAADTTVSLNTLYPFSARTMTTESTFYHYKPTLAGASSFVLLSFVVIRFTPSTGPFSSLVRSSHHRRRIL